ncbi:hypothetical protein [Promicromonospora sp. NPDC050880]|uniref:hypothetical protein n=1 Tax=Promicromonospora sp. NPDC050880 TaxID=3364406 RepID=UPI0037AB2199
MVETAYAAWQAGLTAGKASVLVASDSETVRAVNERARIERLHTGATDPGRAVRLADGLDASAGDTVITRRNDRRLSTRNGAWVRNGDRWTLVKVRMDGSVVLRQPEAKYGNTIVLPAAYAAEHLDLGYAVTTHRAQGLTVDTGHLIAGPGMTRENLYVGLTRGRESNTAYVITDTPLEITPDDHEDPTPRSILAGIVRTVGAEKAATQVSKDETERWGSVAQLAAEYEPSPRPPNTTAGPDSSTTADSHPGTRTRSSPHPRSEPSPPNCAAPKPTVTTSSICSSSW